MISKGKRGSYEQEVAIHKILNLICNCCYAAYAEHGLICGKQKKRRNPSDIADQFDRIGNRRNFGDAQMDGFL